MSVVEERERHAEMREMAKALVRRRSCCELLPGCGCLVTSGLELGWQAVTPMWSSPPSRKSWPFSTHTRAPQLVPLSQGRWRGKLVCLRRRSTTVQGRKTWKSIGRQVYVLSTALIFILYTRNYSYSLQMLQGCLHECFAKEMMRRLKVFLTPRIFDMPTAKIEYSARQTLLSRFPRPTGSRVG